jgi:hypothetical protein
VCLLFSQNEMNLSSKPSKPSKPSSSTPAHDCTVCRCVSVCVVVVRVIAHLHFISFHFIALHFTSLHFNPSCVPFHSTLPRAPIHTYFVHVHTYSSRTCVLVHVYVRVYTIERLVRMFRMDRIGSDRITSRRRRIV